MYLQEAVQICAGTDRRFRRPEWVAGFRVAVLPEARMFENAYGTADLAYTDLVMIEPNDSEWPVYFDSSDILADDWEVI